METIELPKKPLKATRKDPSRLLLYGPSKIGKTTKLMELANCLTIDTEPTGTDYVEGLKIKAPNCETFRNIIKQIKIENRPYKYLAIDTIDTLEDWAEREATAVYKRSPRNSGNGKITTSVLDLAYGGGWWYVRQEFISLINLAATACDTLILVAHLREKIVEKDGTTITATDLDLSGKLRNIACYNCDAIGYVYRPQKSEELRICFRSNGESAACNSRAKHLIAQDIEFDWDKIFLEQPQQFLFDDAIHNKTTEGQEG